MATYKAYYKGSASACGLAFEGVTYTFDKLVPKEVPEQLACYLERLDCFDITESE